MDPSGLYSAGGSVADLSGDASGASSKFVNSVADAHSSVKQYTLTASIQGYLDRWTSPARALATDVTTVGNKLSGTAVVATAADQQSAADLSSAVSASSASSSLLRKSINIS